MRTASINSQIGDQCDKILNGMTGFGETFASTNKKTPKKMTKRSIVAQTFASLHGREKLFLKLRLSKKLDMQMIKEMHPSQSICFRAAFLEVTWPGTVYLTKMNTRTHARPSKGTCMRNAKRQSYLATIRPPKGAPSAAPI